MKADLNKLYDLMSKEDQQKIDKVIFDYLASFAKDMGFSLTEKIENAPVVRVCTEGKTKRKKYKQRVKFPIELHGLKIPSNKRFVELYKGGKGGWNGEITLAKLRYCFNTKGMTYEEIFPYPPPEENRKTLIKRKNENGDTFYPVGGEK